MSSLKSVRNIRNNHDAETLSSRSPESSRTSGGRRVATSTCQCSGCAQLITIYRPQNRLHATNTTDDLPGNGRPRASTAAQERYILRQHRSDSLRHGQKHCWHTWETAQCSYNPPKADWRSLRSWRPAERPVLSDQHRLNRPQRA